MPESQEPTRGGDTVTGVDTHLRDNAIQALAILVCMVLGAGIGALVAEERVAGAIVGGVLGLIIGCFGSGLVMHARGKHD